MVEKPATTRSASSRRSKLDNVDVKSVNALVQMAFGGLCIFLGGHWQLEDDEALSIAAPASRILAKLPAGTGRKINDSIDPFMLLYAIVAVCGPRVEKTINERKKTNVPTAANTNGKTDRRESTELPISATKLGFG